MADGSRPDRSDRERPPLVFTVDVEDWANGTLGPERPITARFLKGLEQLLSLLAEHDARATFFILGAAAEKFPQAVRDVAAAGHDVASHGYRHVPVYSLDRERFRDDLRRVGEVLERIAGSPPRYYRAPDFSIDEDSLWAFEVLAEEGYLADASVFPMRTPRYGIPWWPQQPGRIPLPDGRSLIEWPVTTRRLLGRRLPAAGGGYTRLLPFWMLRANLRVAAGDGTIPVLYCHPYETDADELSLYRRGLALSTRLSQFIGRRGVLRKWRRFCASFEVVALSQALDSRPVAAYDDAMLASRLRADSE